MSTLLDRTRLTVRDLRNRRLLRTGASLLMVARARARRANTQEAVLAEMDELCKAARLATSDEMLQDVEARIAARLGDVAMDPGMLDSFVPYLDRPYAGKAVILKPWISEREPGVIFMSADYEWWRLLKLPNLEDFANRYHLILSPGWSPPHSLIHYLFPLSYPKRFFSIISNVRDLEHFPRISPRHRMIPLFASSWVNPAWFKPRPRAERDIDLIMVANFGQFKRHHALFSAMRQLPQSLKITLVGQDNIGRTDKDIHAEADAFGVDGRFDVIRNAKHQQVLDLFCRSRSSVVLSLREGSCVAVAESMFADTPCGLLQEAEIGSRAFINPDTGRALSSRRLGHDLNRLIEDADGIKPRAWAEANLSCFRSTELMNAYVKSAVIQDGEAWTRDLLPHHWRPDPEHVSDQDRAALLPEYESLHARYGVAFGSWGVARSEAK